MAATLRLACVDCYAPPLFGLADPDGSRHGYEPAAAALVAAELGMTVEWVLLPFGEMMPAARDHRVDAVWCGQAITDYRSSLVDFTRPYAIFDESVLVPRGSGLTDQAMLVGKKVAAIADSANLALAKTFRGAVPVPFDGGVADVFGEMIRALRRGEVDAVVDDDVAFASLANDTQVEIGFTVRTRNRWAVGVAKDRPELRNEIDHALASVIADGRLEKAWQEWIPALDYPRLS